jgi:hypothetical protein
VTDNKSCANCAWFSDGFQSDPNYCYSQDIHVDEADSCEDWQASLRAEPVNQPPLLTPEEMLAKRVQALDREEEG